MDFVLITYILALALALVMAFFVFYVFFNDLFVLATESKLVKRVLGAVLVLIGVAGIFLPIIPGWLLIFVGLGLMKVLVLERLVKRIAKKLGIKEPEHENKSLKE